MYYTPFGSIFGEDKPGPKGATEPKPKPGFLNSKGDPVSILKRAKTGPPPPKNLMPKCPAPKGPVPKGPVPKGTSPKMVAKGKPPAKPKPKPDLEKALLKSAKAPPKVMDALKKRFDDLKKEKVYKAKKTKIDIKKIAPQFKFKSKVVTKDPQVKLINSKLDEIKSKRFYKTLEERLGEIKKKTKSAQIYRDILVHFSKMKPEEKTQLDAWIKGHSAPIKNVSVTRNLAKKTSRIKEAIKSVDLEIKYYEKLNKLKEQGLDVMGKKVIARVSPNEKPLPPAKLPKFKQKIAPVPKIEYKKLPPQLAGYGDAPIKPGPEPAAAPKLPPGFPGFKPPPAPSPKAGEPAGAPAGPPAGPPAKAPPKPKPKPGAIAPTIKPKSSLVRPEEKNVILSKEHRDKLAKEGTIQKIVLDKDSRYSGDKPKGKPVNVKKQLEKNLIETKQVEWKTKRLEKKVEQHLAKYEQLQNEIKTLIGKLVQQSPENKQITTTLGILAEARPEKFVVSASLLDSLKQSFKRIPAQLGETPVPPAPEPAPTAPPAPAPATAPAPTDAEPTPKQEAESALEKAAVNSEVALRELETRQHALAVLKSKLEGKPPPPPPPPPIPAAQISVYLQQQAPPPPPKAAPAEKTDIVKTLNRLLPIVAGFLLITKLLG